MLGSHGVRWLALLCALPASCLLTSHARADALRVQVIVGSRSAMPDCDQSVPFYGPVAVGGLVALDRHRPWRGDPNWSPGMEPYIGQVATVVELAGLDSVGCPGVRVDVDGAQFFWRIRDMDLARTVSDAGGPAPLTSTGYADREPEVEYPYAYVDRPLVLAEGMLSPALGLGLLRTPAGSGEAFAGAMDLALDYGVTDFLELGIDVAPIRLAPTVEYDNPSLRGTLRFLRGELEFGLRIDGVLPFRDTSSFVLRLALPLLGHLGGIGRIDLTPQFAFRFDTPIVTVFSAPLALSFNLGSYCFLGAVSGVALDVDRAGTSLYVPLGAFLGGTIPGDVGPLADVRASFGFPTFYAIAHGSSPIVDVWQVSLDARFYIYLL